MISLVLPYWERLEAAQTAVRALARCYASLELEVIVVDDGSPHAFVPPAVPFELRVIRLEAKQKPKNPCVPLNAGIRAARGEFLALSGVEMLHGEPVLPAMRDAVRALGSSGYVTAAARADGDRWHSHSSLLPLVEQGIRMPDRAHYHFLAMGHASLIKGVLFDEDYRDGAGYDDPDFLLRLQRAGATFELRDDLVVSHPRKDARSAWLPEMFERNRRLFLSKWT